MKFRIFIIAFVILLSNFLSAQAQSKPCGCSDKKDLLNRLNVVEAAIQEYRVQIEVMKEQEKKEGKPLMLTKERYDILENSVNTAMNRVKAPSARSATAKSNGGNCDFKEINAPTDCLRESITRHEKVHHRACLAIFQDTPAFPNETYQTRMRLADFAQEEIFAYLEERKFILSQLQSSPKDCIPNNWFGYVVYQKVETTVLVKTLPPKNDTKIGSNGGSDTKGTKITYIGTVLVEDGKAASAKAYAAYSFDQSYMGSFRDRCTSKNPIADIVNTSGMNTFGDGENEGSAEFSLSFYLAKGSYDITARFFPVNVTGQTNSWSKSVGEAAGCRNKEDSKNAPFTFRADKDGYSVTDEKIKSGFPDYLEGSKIDKPPLRNQSSQEGNTSGTQTFEIQMRWMLRRLPK